MAPFFYKDKLSSTALRDKHKQRLWQWKEVQWQPKEEQYCAYRLDGTTAAGWVRVKQFTNGTFYLEAVSEELLQEALKHLSIRSQADKNSSTGEKTTAVNKISPCVLNTTGKVTVGSDESGKGDYFGPLVVASAWVEPHQVDALLKIGVKDCKLVNNKQLLTIAEGIADTLGLNQLAVVELMPERYNQVYAQYQAQKKNLNHMLAKAHASALQALFTKQASEQTQPVTVIVDQFAKDTRVMHTAIDKALHQRITLVQMTKAEAELAVAAASIIARHRFVLRLQQLGDELGTPLPLGAGSPVIACAKKLAPRLGRSGMAKIAKLHFKTTEQLPF